jgi:hypothetical protein
MYLSKITPQKDPFLAAHRLVMRGFPDTDSESPRSMWNVLYRVEPDGCLLVQSDILPDWSAVLPVDAVTTKQYDPRLIEGKCYRYRMALNPVAVRQGRRCPVSVETWLGKRDLGAHFEIKSVFPATDSRSQQRASRSYSTSDD